MSTSNATALLAAIEHTDNLSKMFHDAARNVTQHGNFIETARSIAIAANELAHGTQSGTAEIMLRLTEASALARLSNTVYAAESAIASLTRAIEAARATLGANITAR